MPHDAGGHLDECTSKSFQINSVNLQTKSVLTSTCFHDLHRDLVSSLNWVINVKEGSDWPRNCKFIGQFGLVCPWARAGRSQLAYTVKTCLGVAHEQM